MKQITLGEEIEILKYAKENIDLKDKEVSVEIFGDLEQVYWGYSLLEYINYEPALDDIAESQNKLTYKYSNIMGKINNVDYIIYFVNSYYYSQVGEELFTENSEIIYQNESGGIVKYNIE